MSSNALSQYPARNFRKRRASDSNDRLAASDQSPVSIDRSLPQWYGTVTNGAHVESSHEDTSSPSAVSYAANLCLPETSFYDFELPENSYADPVSVYTPGLGWETTPFLVDTYPFPHQAFSEDRSPVYAPDPSAGALPQVPSVPSQRSLTSRELAPDVSTLYRGGRNEQSLPSGMALHIASQHTTSETSVASTVFSENPLVRGFSFTTAAEDNSGYQRSSYSSRQNPADTVSAGPVSISAASNATGSRFITDPQNVENPLGQPDTTYTLNNGSRMPDLIVNIDDLRDPPRDPFNRWISIISQSHDPVNIRFGRFSKANVSKRYGALEERLKSLEILSKVLPRDHTFLRRVAQFNNRLEDETFRRFVGAGYVSLLIGRVGSIRKSYDDSLKAKPNAKPWLHRSRVRGNFQVLEKDFLTINQAYRLKEAWKLDNLVLYHDF